MEEKQEAKKPHDAFFRWLFADVNHLRLLLELAGKVNVDVADFLAAVKLDTLVRIPDSRGFGFPRERLDGRTRICGHPCGTQVRPRCRYVQSACALHAFRDETL